MNGNFDNFSYDDNTDGLTTYWEQAESDYKDMAIDNAISNMAFAINADDYAWEVRAHELHSIYDEAMNTLRGYGFSMAKINRMLAAM